MQSPAQLGQEQKKVNTLLLIRKLHFIFDLFYGEGCKRGTVIGQVQKQKDFRFKKSKVNSARAKTSLIYF